MAPLDIAVLVEAGDWPPEAALLALADKAFSAACAELALASDRPSEVSLVFTDDEPIRVLNRDWRGKDKATNVLSFPAVEQLPEGRLPPMLGDIVIAAGTVRREAEVEDKPFEHHLLHLLVHGFLHLLQYDHEDEADAEEMEATERRILARIAIPDPYR